METSPKPASALHSPWRNGLHPKSLGCGASALIYPSSADHHTPNSTYQRAWYLIGFQWLISAWVHQGMNECRAEWMHKGIHSGVRRPGLHLTLSSALTAINDLRASHFNLEAQISFSVKRGGWTSLENLFGYSSSSHNWAQELFTKSEKLSFLFEKF